MFPFLKALSNHNFPVSSGLVEVEEHLLIPAFGEKTTLITSGAKNG